MSSLTAGAEYAPGVGDGDGVPGAAITAPDDCVDDAVGDAVGVVRRLADDDG